jgi:hypothetical protein
VDREDGRARDDEGRVGDVEGGEGDTFEAAVERHGPQRGVRTAATVREGTPPGDGRESHAGGDAEDRTRRDPVEGQRDREAAEDDEQRVDETPNRNVPPTGDGEDEDATEQAGADGGSDDEREVEARRGGPDAVCGDGRREGNAREADGHHATGGAVHFHGFGTRSA